MADDLQARFLTPGGPNYPNTIQKAAIFFSPLQVGHILRGLQQPWLFIR
jgi:hypothetical protein